MSASVVNPVGFVEHLQNGLMINFSVGIDFTGSNGDPTQLVTMPTMHTSRLRSRLLAECGPENPGKRSTPSACVPPSLNVWVAMVLTRQPML